MSSQDASQQGSTEEYQDSDYAYESMREHYKQISRELAQHQAQIHNMEASGESKDRIKNSYSYKKRDELQGERDVLENEWVNETPWKIEELRKE